MEKRPYGKSDEKLSILGFGGIIVMNESQENANNYVDEAILKLPQAMVLPKNV